MQSCFKFATVFTCLVIFMVGGVANAQRPGFSNSEEYRKSIRSRIPQAPPSRPSAPPSPTPSVTRSTPTPKISISNGSSRPAPSRFSPPPPSYRNPTPQPRPTITRTNPVVRTNPIPIPAPVVVRTVPEPEPKPAPVISKPSRLTQKPSLVINTPNFPRPNRPTPPVPVPAPVVLPSAPTVVSVPENPKVTSSVPKPSRQPSRPSFKSNKFPRLVDVVSPPNRPSIPEREPEVIRDEPREPQPAPVMTTRTETPEPISQPAPEPDRSTLRPVDNDTPRSNPNRAEREPEIAIESREPEVIRNESGESQPAPAMVVATETPDITIPDALKPDQPSRPSREDVIVANPGDHTSRSENGPRRPRPENSPILPVEGTITDGGKTSEVMTNPSIPVIIPEPENVTTNGFPADSIISTERPARPNQRDFTHRHQTSGTAIPSVGLVNLGNNGPRAHRQSPQSPLDLFQMITRLRGVSALSANPTGRLTATPILNRVVRVDPGNLSILRCGSNPHNNYYNNYNRCEYFRPILTPVQRALISIQIGSPRICPPYSLYHGYVDPCRPYCIPAPPFIPDYCYNPCRTRSYYTVPELSPRYSTNSPYSTVPAAYPVPYSPPVTLAPMFGYGAEGDPSALSYQVDASSQLSTNEVNFVKNSTDLADGEDNVFLYNLAAALNSTELIDFKFVIEGHASAEGSAAANQKLSQLRANSIFDFLVNQGVASSRLLAVGHGEQQAVYQTTDPDYLRAKDRRVIIYKLADTSK
jgi:outer membrane protein OmpA-like peptidoglycan-associated protein